MPLMPESKHGGRRPGAGRKRKPGATVTCAFVLTQQQATWLRDRAALLDVSKSELMRSIVEQARRAAAV